MTHVMDVEWAFETKTELGTLNSFIWSGSLPLTVARDQLRRVSTSKKGILLKVPSGFFTQEKKFKTPGEAIAEIESWIPDYVLKGKDCEWAYKQRSEYATLNPFVWSGPLSFGNCIEKLDSIPESEKAKGFLVKIPSGISTVEEVFDTKDEAIAFVHAHSPDQVVKGALSKIEKARADLNALEAQITAAKEAVEGVVRVTSSEVMAAKKEADAKFKELETKQMQAMKEKVDAAESAAECERQLESLKAQQKELEESLPKLRKEEADLEAKLKSTEFTLVAHADTTYCLGLSGDCKNGSHVRMTACKEKPDNSCIWTLDNGVLRPKSAPKFGLCILQSGLKPGGALHMWTTSSEKPDGYSYWVVQHGLLKNPKDEKLALHVCKGCLKERGEVEMQTLDGTKKNDQARWLIMPVGS